MGSVGGHVEEWLFRRIGMDGLGLLSWPLTDF